MLPSRRCVFRLPVPGGPDGKARNASGAPAPPFDSLQRGPNSRRGMARPAPHRSPDRKSAGNPGRMRPRRAVSENRAAPAHECGGRRRLQPSRGSAGRGALRACRAVRHARFACRRSPRSGTRAVSENGAAPARECGRRRLQPLRESVGRGALRACRAVRHARFACRRSPRSGTRAVSENRAAPARECGRRRLQPLRESAGRGALRACRAVRHARFACRRSPRSGTRAVSENRAAPARECGRRRLQPFREARGAALCAHAAPFAMRGSHAGEVLSAARAPSLKTESRLHANAGGGVSSRSGKARGASPRDKFLPRQTAAHGVCAKRRRPARRPAQTKARRGLQPPPRRRAAS